jgi:hypothetical protein
MFKPTFVMLLGLAAVARLAIACICSAPTLDEAERDTETDLAECSDEQRSTTPQHRAQ